MIMQTEITLSFDAHKIIGNHQMLHTLMSFRFLRMHDCVMAILCNFKPL